MAVTKVFERWEGRNATTDEEGVQTLKRQWSVETDTDLDYEPTVINGVTAFDASATLYHSHPAWPAALCRELEATPNGGPRKWLVNATYNTKRFAASGDGSGTGTGNDTTPTLAQSNQTQADQRPPTLQITRKEITKPLEKDLTTGKRVCNTVGDPFIPPPEVFRSHQLLTWKIFRTPAQLAWSTRAAFMDSVNADAVTIFGKTYAAGTLRCTDYALSTVWETGASGLAFFLELTVQAEYDPDGWQPNILNTGRRKYVSGSLGDPDNPPKTAVIVDENGQPVDDPVPLTAGGLPVVPPDTVAYVSATGYTAVNWLGTGSSLTGAGGLLA